MKQKRTLFTIVRKNPHKMFRNKTSIKCAINDYSIFYKHGNTKKRKKMTNSWCIPLKS